MEDEEQEAQENFDNGISDTQELILKDENYSELPGYQNAPHLLLFAHPISDAVYRTYQVVKALCCQHGKMWRSVHGISILRGKSHVTIRHHLWVLSCCGLLKRVPRHTSSGLEKSPEWHLTRLECVFPEIVAQTLAESLWGGYTGIDRDLQKLADSYKTALQKSLSVADTKYTKSKVRKLTPRQKTYTPSENLPYPVRKLTTEELIREEKIRSAQSDFSSSPVSVDIDATPPTRPNVLGIGVMDKEETPAAVVQVDIEENPTVAMAQPPTAHDVPKIKQAPSAPKPVTWQEVVTAYRVGLGYSDYPNKAVLGSHTETAKEMVAHKPLPTIEQITRASRWVYWWLTEQDLKKSRNGTGQPFWMKRNVTLKVVWKHWEDWEKHGRPEVPLSEVKTSKPDKPRQRPRDAVDELAEYLAKEKAIAEKADEDNPFPF